MWGQRVRQRNQCSKLVASRDKEVNQAARDSNAVLVCCVEDRIMDYGASFHATCCKEELERFKLRSGKVRLVDDKTLDIAGIGDAVLKTSFGYHVGFGDQQWKVTKCSLVVAHGNKRGSLFMVEVHPKGIDTIINGSGSAAMWHQILGDMSKIGGLGKQKKLSFIMSEKTRKLQKLKQTAAGVAVGLHIPEGEWRGKDTSLAHLKVFGCDSFVKVKDVCGEAMKYSIYEARSATDSSSLTKLIQKSQVVLVDILENLAENDNIVAEHGLSSEITQSPDGALFKEGGSETPQVRRSTRESRASVRYSPLANYLLLTKNGEPESYLEALSSKESVQWKKAINEEMVSLEKNQTCYLVRISVGKKASQRLWMFKVKEEQDSSKSWAKLVRILISEGSLSLLKIFGTKSLAAMFTRIPCIESLLALRLVGVTCSRVPYVQRHRKVRAVALLKGRWFEVYRDYLRRRAVK
ncbi:retrovirus-related pol polyprotein from transposon TNT 1-94 [Tanacetum coccineum]|uniref:Retrovirus-related pol polyprotein from transposon TNT 1-94 n=1 Tax=Tanacetum coccineum TaxID=301880 RepID=A0ABQ4YW53_9ASTR